MFRMRAQGSCVSTSCAYWARVSVFRGTKRRIAFVQVMSKAMFTPCASRMRLISAFARAPAMPTLGIVGEKCVCGCRALSTCAAAAAAVALRSEASQPSLRASVSPALLRLGSTCGAATASSALRSEASQPSLHAAESAAWLLLARLCETELDFARRNEGCGASE